MSTSSTLIKDEEIIKEEVTDEVYKKSAMAKQAISQNNLKVNPAETCDLTSVTGYEGTSLNDVLKLNRLRPKQPHPQVSGPNIKNVSPSTYQKSLNRLITGSS